MLGYFICANEVQIVEKAVRRARPRPTALRLVARDRHLQKRVRTASLLINRVTTRARKSPFQYPMVCVEVKLERRRTKSCGT